MGPDDEQVRQVAGTVLSIGSRVATQVFIATSIICVVSILYLLVTAVVDYRRLRHIPGPWLAHVSPLWLFVQTCRSRMYIATEELHEQYGRLVRVSPDQLITDDPDFFKLMVDAKSQFTRGYWYDAVRFDPRKDHVFSMKDKPEHDKLKAKLLPGYLGKDGIDLEGDISAQVVKLITLINRDYISKDRAFDFAHLPGYFTMDSLTKIAFGMELGFLEKNQDVYDYFKNTTPFLKVLELGANHPWILVVNNFIAKFTGPTPADRIGLGAVMGKAQEAVAERFKPDHDLINARDQLSSFIRRGLTQIEAEAEAMIQIIAGVDSTAQAIRTTFIGVVSNPIANRKLVAEIDKAVENGAVSYPVIKYSEALTLPYLQACIKEGLRFFMPLNGLGGKETPPEGFTYDGIYIPPKTQIGISEYAMLRRKDIFGPDADTFRPDRWLEKTDPDIMKRREFVQSLAFGYGPTSCIGKQIALFELSKVIFELFRNYEYIFVNPLAEIKTKTNGPAVQTGINVRAWSRNSD